MNIDNIEDVQDSLCYKKFKSKEQGKTIALGYNFDGIAPYNVSSYDLWPFYLNVLNLPFEERFKEEKCGCCWMWGGHHKPAPNIFMRPIQRELDDLKTQGIDAEPNESGSVDNYKVSVVSGTCDVPARCAFFNSKGTVDTTLVLDA